MHLNKPLYCCWLFLSLLSCNQSKNESNSGFQSKNTSPSQTVTNVVAENSSESGLAGEWDQQFSVMDNNGNGVLDEEERNDGKKVHLGFDYFKFNTDGTCLRDRDLQFKGTYRVEEKNGKKKLLIEGSDKLKYIIIGLTPTELILGSDGAFILFKRID